ncbi:MAG TPA: hypothetical protein VM638_06875 [Actinomycetota bacterium]|nr:hypothetical protein [Actinomycetota bacterium]
MRRPVSIASILLLLATPAGGQDTSASDPRYLAYIEAEENDGTGGALVVVRSDGKEEPRTLLERGVLAADIAPGVPDRVDDPAGGETLPESRLLKIDIETGEREDVLPDETAHYLGVAASPRGDIAFYRTVARAVEPPSHLAPAIPELRQAAVPVLAPPEEPPDTGNVAADGHEDGYALRYTNDPTGGAAHAEQRVVFVEATVAEELPVAEGEGESVTVRGTQGVFYCGAATCFVSWRENETTYTVGEFGDQGEAIAFAESLQPMEDLAGIGWQSEEPFPTPELIVLREDGERVTLESVEGFCECGFPPVSWRPSARRLLVAAMAEGYTTLQEYRANGRGRPRTLAEGSIFEGPGGIFDAAYAGDRVLTLVAGDSGPPGDLRALGGGVLREDVRAFDTHGSLLAYVTGGGAVRLLDLTTDEEVRLARGAIDVSIAPDTIEEDAPPPAPNDEGPPLVLLVLILLALASLGLGTALYVAARRRRRR